MKKIVSKVINKSLPSVVLKGETRTGYILEIYDPELKLRQDVAISRETLNALNKLLTPYYASTKNN